MNPDHVVLSLDVREHKCPVPFVRFKRHFLSIDCGILEILVSDDSDADAILKYADQHNCKTTRHRCDTHVQVWVQRREGDSECLEF